MEVFSNYSQHFGEFLENFGVHGIFSAGLHVPPAILHVPVHIGDVIL